MHHVYMHRTNHVTAFLSLWRTAAQNPAKTETRYGNNNLSLSISVNQRVCVVKVITVTVPSAAATVNTQEADLSVSICLQSVNHVSKISPRWSRNDVCICGINGSTLTLCLHTKDFAYVAQSNCH